MIGQWLRFGEGTAPADGEALVFIRNGQPPIDAVLYAQSYAEAVVAIHRSHVLFEQGGTTGPIPIGCWWTSLPPPPNTVS